MLIVPITFGDKGFSPQVSRLTRTSSAVIGVAAAAVSVACAQGPKPVNYSPMSAAVPSAIALTPNAQGYVRVETKSGSTGCSINTELVACERFSGSWQNADGRRYPTVSVAADGEFHWVDADLGQLQGRVPLNYQTYSARGWTIVVGPDDTKFTNDDSGHGMSVADKNVTPF